MMPAAVVITILPNCEERGTSRKLGQCIAESFGATHQGHGLSRRRRVSRVALDAWEQHSTGLCWCQERGLWEMDSPNATGADGRPSPPARTAPRCSGGCVSITHAPSSSENCFMRTCKPTDPAARAGTGGALEREHAQLPCSTVPSRTSSEPQQTLRDAQGLDPLRPTAHRNRIHQMQDQSWRPGDGWSGGGRFVVACRAKIVPGERRDAGGR
jgi:hypothetical protein